MVKTPSPLDIPVLLVDDNPVTQSVLKSALAGLASEIDVAITGEGAVRCMQQRTFGVIFLNANLQGQNSFAVAELIRADQEGRLTPLVFLSSDADPSMLIRAYEQGAVDVLQIPLPSAVLQAKVAVFVELARRRGLSFAHEEKIRRLEELEKRQAELAATPNALQFALKTAGMVAWDWDLKINEVIFIGDTLQVHGYSPEQLRNPVAAGEFLHPEDRQRVAECILNAIATNTPYQIEFRFVQPDGSVRWLFTQGQAHQGTSGPLQRIGGVVANITARKKAEEDLRLINLALQRSNADLEQFAFAASHDLQEPARTLNSYVRLLARRLEGKLDPETEEFLAFIEDGSYRMIALIQSLLSFAKAFQGEQETAPVDCGQVVQTALSNCKMAIQNSGAIVEIGAMPSVKAEFDLLVHLFQNLISNAAKYVKPGNAPRISILSEDAGEFWRISVADNGIGIPAKSHEQIFVLFKRLHGRDYPGSGIGLAFCRRIVERYGGRIWVESEPDQGAVFYILLPKTPPDS